MARNEEKSRSMLNRYLQQKAEDRGMNEKRPKVPGMEKSLPKAERWRMEVIREIGRKAAAIQNTGLNEHRVRELNDEINRLIRDKSSWEKRIRELGGADYSKERIQIATEELGHVSAGSVMGYQYFGAARKLPGVAELLAPKKERTHNERGKADLSKYVDLDYYGLRDDEDGVLIEQEEDAEKKALEYSELERRKADAELQRHNGSSSSSSSSTGGQNETVSDDDWLSIFSEKQTSDDFVFGSADNSMQQLTLKDIQQAALEAKRREALAKFGISS
eukprot:TRINITY_DN2444_c0_g1_i1.p1 TRINITY_DN2444_c0_g1~~TRINITY_DN2444_c0_g1_i1.p1  ORF type:complete len:276 (-),score=105.49 TRINITY_DN2444_c0_g1_i1:191-1018(-)